MRMAFLSLCGFVGVACGPGLSGPGTTDDDNHTAGRDGGTTTGGDGGDIDPGPDPGPDPVPTAGCREMDIVFVIDNSGSMKEEQTNLATNFPKFIEVLDAFRVDGLELDYRVAVTTTGVAKTYFIPPIIPLPGLPPTPVMITGESGAFQTGNGCNMPRAWLERTDSNVGSTFSCVAQVGTNGSGMEMPLEGMRLSLSDRIDDGTNAGFLRKDALLAIVFLTDEEDCSREDDGWTVGSFFDVDICDVKTATPVSRYVSFLDTVKTERGRWAAAALAGETSCMSEFGSADEATRLKKFIVETGKNGVFSSICAGDLTAALKDALDTFQIACNSFPPIE
jgi:hypothetical protein